eukprot:gene25724-11382_t
MSSAPAGPPPGAVLFQMGISYIATQSVSVAARLDVPDHIHAGHTSIEALAKATKCSLDCPSELPLCPIAPFPPSPLKLLPPRPMALALTLTPCLFDTIRQLAAPIISFFLTPAYLSIRQAHQGNLQRMLKACASVGVFKEVSPGVFANTELSELLRSDVPGSMKSFLSAIPQKGHFEAAVELYDCVLQGGKAPCRMKQPIFEYYNQPENKAEALCFSEAMTSTSSLVSSIAVELFDFSPFKTIVDIGGAEGALMKTILAAVPSSDGIVFDLPLIADNAKAKDTSDLGSRVQFVGGDFFESVPAADLFLLKFIIHDWGNEESIKILKSCQPSMANQMDVLMMCITGGSERTSAQYEALFTQAGFKTKRAIPAAALIMYEVEAV